jgi:beta-galactosidase
MPACYCEVSADHFRRWLRARYGELEELNRVWGTAFWGQRYGDWSEIAPPRRTPAFVNPSQALDWARFCSDAFLECYEAERAVLARLTPGSRSRPTSCAVKPCDYWAWASREDVVTSIRIPIRPTRRACACCARLRPDAFARNGTGCCSSTRRAINWREINVPKRPG